MKKLFSSAANLYKQSVSPLNSAVKKAAMFFFNRVPDLGASLKSPAPGLKQNLTA